MSLARALLLPVTMALAVACGFSSHGDDDDHGAGDADSDSDGDGDGDARPACPEGEDLVIGDPCTAQDECDAPTCGRQGGVCIEETWTCGRCDYCFFTRTPHVEDTGLTCDEETGRCL